MECWGNGAASQVANKMAKATSCVAMGYLGQSARVHPAVSKALEDAVKERSLIFQAAAFGEFVPRLVANDKGAEDTAAKWDRAASAPDTFLARIGSQIASTNFKRDVSGFDTDPSLRSLQKPLRNATVAHDEVNHLLKTLKVQLEHSKEDHGSVSKELDAVLAYIDKLKPECESKAMSYEERKAAREAEIAGLKEAQTILENETALLQTKSKHFMFVRRDRKSVV